MEATWDHWKIAHPNLKQFPVVDGRWGLSVGRKKAIEFIGRDPAIRNHDEYPEIFIDDVNYPVDFYTREILVPSQRIGMCMETSSVLLRGEFHRVSLPPEKDMSWLI
jgi:hypothetical protein